MQVSAIHAKRDQDAIEACLGGVFSHSLPAPIPFGKGIASPSDIRGSFHVRSSLHWSIHFSCLANSSPTAGRTLSTTSLRICTVPSFAWRGLVTWRARVHDTATKPARRALL